MGAYADEFLRCVFSNGSYELMRLLLAHRHLEMQIAAAEANVPQTVVLANGVYGPVNPEAADRVATESAFVRLKRAFSTKCAECGLDGNHDTWCPHWQPYVADET